MGIKILKGVLISLAAVVVLINLLILYLKFWPAISAKKTLPDVVLQEDEIQPTTENITKKAGYIYCPILLYHHIAKVVPQDSYSVSPEIFGQQMKWLENNGYTVIKYDDFYQAMNKKKTLPPKPVVISFDDGVLDQYQSAFPILKQYNYSAMFFIKLNNVGEGKGGMTWQMLKDLSDAKMEIGSHSINHDSMSNMDLTTMRSELTDSKKTLEQNLGLDINYFAYPGGAFSSTTETETKAAGYISAVSTKHLVYHKFGEDLFAVPRIHIDDEMPTFIDWVQGKNLK